MNRLLPLLLLLPACVIGSDRYQRPRDLDPSWLIDRPRILAVRPSPAEARPGDTVTFESLVVDPTERIGIVLWLACGLPGADGSAAGCDLSALESLDPETATPEDLEAAGVIGLEPYLAPSWEVPEDALDGFETEHQLRRGLAATLQILAFPDDVDPSAEIDFGEVEVATKQVPISLDPSANTNPEIALFRVDDQEVPAGVVVEVDAGQTYTIGIEHAAGSVEAYQYLNSQNELEDRVEEPYTQWYTTGGDMLEPYTLHPHDSATWTAPEESGTTGTWYAVVRDRRGGMAWWVHDWRVR